MRGYSFLAWAYNLVWIGIAAYLLFLFVRLRSVTRKLDRLEDRAAGSGGPSSSSGAGDDRQ
jgi:CcmD family protein